MSNNPQFNSYSSDYASLNAYATKNNVDLKECDNANKTDPEKETCKIEYIQKHMRDNIDRKVAEIYKTTGTNSAAFDENYRTTMLVGVVWAMLGTTVLYYTFKNL